MATKSKAPGHISRGSVLRDIALDPQERLELEIKADLHQQVLKLIRTKRLTPRQLEKKLDVPQPRVSELLNGKLSVLSIAKLLLYASQLGAQINIRLKATAA
jgi:predicted XRE-type DNA-binding protein